MPDADVVVIGGGHNGLVAAAYLARAGARVTVLEQRSQLGGACATEETWPGFRMNTYAYVAGLLRPEIVRDLELPRFGYRTLLFDPQLFGSLPHGRPVKIWTDVDRTVREIQRFSAADARAYPKYQAFWERAVDQVGPLLLVPPGESANLLRSFPGEDGERLVRDLLLRSAADFLDDWFESEELKGTLAINAVIGTFLGPRSPGTAYVLAHHSLGILDGHREVWGFAVGGMGSISRALAASATHAGAELRTSCRVRGIRVRDGRAVAVETAEGEEIAGRAVVSTVDARQTFLKLVPPDSLDRSFRQKVGRIRSRGAQVKLNAALTTLPEFRSEPGAPSDAHRGAVELSPSLEYLERAYDDAKRGRFSEHPFMEILFQSATDPSVAPPGHHTMSCFVQYAPPSWSVREWDERRGDVEETVVRELELHAPTIRHDLEATQLVTPPDLERELGLTGGSIFQGDITPDQMFAFRPVPGWANYRTPIPGLYLGGSAAHPGGGVLGAPGHNVAQAVLADLGSRVIS